MVIVSWEKLEISVEIIAQEFNTTSTDSSSFPDVVLYLSQIYRGIVRPATKLWTYMDGRVLKCAIVDISVYLVICPRCINVLGLQQQSSNEKCHGTDHDIFGQTIEPVEKNERVNQYTRDMNTCSRQYL